MTDPRERERLFADFLAGQLDEAGAERLLAILREDPAAREELAGLQDIDLLAAMIARSPEEREEFAQRVMVSLADTRRRERLTEAVLRDVRGEPTPRAGEAGVSRPSLPRRKAIGPTRRSRALPWAAAAAILLGAGAGIYFLAFRTEPLPPPEPVATLQEATPGVNVRRGAEVVAGQRGTPLFARDTVLVPASGAAAIVYADATRLEAGAHSVLRVSPDAGARAAGKRAYLERGTLTAIVRKQPTGQPMVLATPHAEASVLGTRLTLGVTPESTRLEVTDGMVLCTHRESRSTIEVMAGQYALATRGLPLAVKPITEEEPPAPLPPGSAILFRESFAGPSAPGWTGERQPAPGAPPRDFALRSVRPDSADGPAFFAILRSPWQEQGWSLGKHTYLRFRYLAEGFTERQGLKLMVKRKDQTNFEGFLDAPTLGRWETVTVRIGDFVHALEAPLTPPAGSTLHQLVWLGYCYRSPVPAGARLWIDDVVLFEAPAETPALRLAPASSK